MFKQVEYMILDLNIHNIHRTSKNSCLLQISIVFAPPPVI